MLTNVATCFTRKLLTRSVITIICHISVNSVSDLYSVLTPPFGMAMLHRNRRQSQAERDFYLGENTDKQKLS